MVFDASGPKVTDESVGVVVEVSTRYGDEEEKMKRLLLILHMGMVAENVKKNTRLGKRIKRLGVHDLLLESGEVAHAAHFMRGLGWREIDVLCRARGF
jgi:putative NIF3 family GTP cyclohydrolase 1 type 2